MSRSARVLLAASVVAMCLLVFVWPLAVSADPAHPLFRIVAIATFAVFFASLIVVLVARLRDHR